MTLPASAANACPAEAMSDPSKYQTGRTTRMLQEAITLARLSGEKVYVLLNTQHECQAIKHYKMPDMNSPDWRHLGIEFHTPDTLPSFNWETMRIRGDAHRVVLVDHSVIERRFGKMMEMMVKYDAPRGWGLLKERLHQPPA